MIVDEAHNAGTPLSFETLQRIRPAAVIELTATPAADRENGSNVLYSVSALELKAEDMIKLPVMLFGNTPRLGKRGAGCRAHAQETG